MIAMRPVDMVVRVVVGMVMRVTVPGMPVVMVLMPVMPMAMMVMSVMIMRGRRVGRRRAGRSPRVPQRAGKGGLSRAVGTDHGPVLAGQDGPGCAGEDALPVAEHGSTVDLDEGKRIHGSHLLPGAACFCNC